MPAGGEAGRVLPLVLGLLEVGGEVAEEGRVLRRERRPSIRKVLRRWGEHGGGQRGL